MKKDIVIPYKPNGSGEMEACLRLIEKNVPHNKVYVIDHKFSDISHIDQILKLDWAIENNDLTDEFYLFNDDFFVMEPIEETPYYHRGTLTEHIASRPTNDYYTRSLKNTSEILGPDSLSYEMHLPFLFNTRKLKDALVLLEHGLQLRRAPHIRSFYGNLYKVGGQRSTDVKNVPDFKTKTYLSTTESTFKRGAIGDYIRSKI